MSNVALDNSDVQVDTEAGTTPQDQPKKTIYVARWHDDIGILRTIRLTSDMLSSLPEFTNGNSWQLEEKVCKRAIEYGLLFDGERLDYCSQHCISDNHISLEFVFCPAEDSRQRKRNLKQRHPDWVELDHNRLLARIGAATFVLVIAQFILLLQQNMQFDGALNQFTRVVENYIWQANTPGLWPTYLIDSDQIDLVNYSQTPIGITSIRLMTHGAIDSPGKPTLPQSMPANIGIPARLRENDAMTISMLLTQTSIMTNGTDLNSGVILEVDYVYLGNRYQLSWPADVQYKGRDILIRPRNEPVIKPVYLISPVQTPTVP